jgi:ketosteroid isomerase-like protein
MSQDNVELVGRTVDAFNRGDIAAVLAVMAPDVEWIDPQGPMPPPAGSGSRRGPEAVSAEVFAVIPEAWEELRVDVDDLIDGGDRVIVTGSFRGRARDGGELDAPFAMVFTVRDGKVVRYRNYPDTHRLAEALAGRPSAAA